MKTPNFTNGNCARDRILGGLWGSIVGDALGVPVEFQSRQIRETDPVTDLRAYGSHNQPLGTWSDDSSLMLCTVESLLEHEFNTSDMGNRFVAWLQNGRWTPWGKVFDVGAATSDALMAIASGVPAEEAGRTDERSNGNGSLMRSLPVALRFANEPAGSFVDRIQRVSKITHRHVRCQMACAFHGLVVRSLLRGVRPMGAMAEAAAEFKNLYSTGLFEREVSLFSRFLDGSLAYVKPTEIASGGYVMDTLAASLWCLLNSANFETCVLRAVNLGGDTDTTGCVAGGLAGIYYQLDWVPLRWRQAMARAREIESAVQSFSDLCSRTRLKTEISKSK